MSIDPLILRRGDDEVLQSVIYLNPDTGVVYPLTNVTDIKFTVRKNSCQGDVLLQKSLNNGITIVDVNLGQIQISIAGSDTAGLPAVKLECVYDIELNENGVKRTVTSYGLPLNILPDVSY